MKNTELTRQLKKYIDDTCKNEGAIFTGYTQIRKITNTLVIVYPYPEEIFTKNFIYKTKRLKDEYKTNKEIHKKIVTTLSKEGYQTKEKSILSLYGDLRPIARSANIGDFGINGLIVNDKYGSNMLFSTIFTDAPIALDEDLYHKQTSNIIDNCSKCRKCIDSCPGNAFENGIFSFHKCLPYALKGCNECSRNCKR